MSPPRRVGICIPPRPLPGDPGYDTPRAWGCLKPSIHAALMSTLESIEGVRFIPLDFREAWIADGKVWLDEVCLSELDAFFWYCEIDRQPGAYAMTILHTLAATVPVFPDPARWSVAVDKLTAHVALARAGLPVPEFLLVDLHNLRPAEEAIERWGAAMLKPRRGAWGKGVTLIEHGSTLRDIAGYLRSTTGHSPDGGLLLERYYDNDISQWSSITVLGGAVMYGYRKLASRQVSLPGGRQKVYDPDEKGGSVVTAVLTEEHTRLAQEAAAVLACPIIGFDMIWVDGHPLIIDENTSPGNYPALYEEAGIDPADALARMIVGLVCV
ncbi:MAG: ribosomal protein S6--L-glutamate ligase [Myxococcota bacterium]|jgi:ribosomal protein S6--L-glutamate ligase